MAPETKIYKYTISCVYLSIPIQRVAKDKFKTTTWLFSPELSQFFREKGRDLTQSYMMTKAPTPTEKSKTQRDNTKTPQTTSITQRLRTDLERSVGGNDSHQTGVVKPVNGLPTFNVFTSRLPNTQNVIWHSWERNFVLFYKIPVSTMIKLLQWRFQAFLDVSLFEKLIWKSCRPQSKTFIQRATPGISYNTPYNRIEHSTRIHHISDRQREALLRIKFVIYGTPF